MACGIKTLYALRNFLPINARLLLYIALIMSHMHYSAVLLDGITENLLTLEKNSIGVSKLVFIEINMKVPLTLN